MENNQLMCIIKLCHGRKTDCLSHIRQHVCPVHQQYLLFNLNVKAELIRGEGGEESSRQNGVASIQGMATPFFSTHYYSYTADRLWDEVIIFIQRLHNSACCQKRAIDDFEITCHLIYSAIKGTMVPTMVPTMKPWRRGRTVAFRKGKVWSIFMDSQMWSVWQRVTRLNKTLMSSSSISTSGMSRTWSELAISASKLNIAKYTWTRRCEVWQHVARLNKTLMSSSSISTSGMSRTWSELAISASKLNIAKYSEANESSQPPSRAPA